MARIRHIALTTKEPAKVAEFYKAAFGLKELRRSPNGAVFLTDGHINMAILNYKTEKSPDVGAHGPNFDGIHHFGFEVDDLLTIPFVRICKSWREVIDDGRDARAVFRLKRPKIDALHLGNPAQHGECLQIECRVGQGTRARLFAGRAAVLPDLPGKNVLTIEIERRLLRRGIAGEVGYRGDLRRPPRCMIVAAAFFVFRGSAMR